MPGRAVDVPHVIVTVLLDKELSHKRGFVTRHGEGRFAVLAPS